MIVLDIIFLIVAVLLIILTLLQGGKSAGASGAITGGNLNVFTQSKERGPEVILSRITLFLGILFFLLAIITRLIAAASIV